MVWSIRIMTDLGCGEVQCPNGCCWQAYERGVTTIRKLILCMCYKNSRSNTCQACATAAVYTKLLIKWVPFMLHKLHNY